MTPRKSKANLGTFPVGDSQYRAYFHNGVLYFRRKYQRQALAIPLQDVLPHAKNVRVATVVVDEHPLLPGIVAP
jgi:hypothetical protein